MRAGSCQDPARHKRRDRRRSELRRGHGLCRIQRRGCADRCRVRRGGDQGRLRGIGDGCLSSKLSGKNVVTRKSRLLRDAGTEVIERTIAYEEVRDADEIFSTGNYAKVKPVNRIDERELQPGPVFRKARELYFAFARDSRFRLPA